jgi:hypothetical protein
MSPARALSGFILLDATGGLPARALGMRQTPADQQPVAPGAGGHGPVQCNDSNAVWQVIFPGAARALWIETAAHALA